MTGPHEKPLAAPGFKSYRYKVGPGACHYVMVGAASVNDALNQTRRSVHFPERLTWKELEIWDGESYRKVSTIQLEITGAAQQQPLTLPCSKRKII